MQPMPILYTGDTFEFPIQFVKTETGVDVGLELTDVMSITAAIADRNGDVIAQPVVTPYADQSANTGYAVVTLPTGQSTDNWAVGECEMQFEVSVNGKVKHSQKFKFIVEASI